MGKVAQAVRAELESLADSERASFLRRFFKTGPGEYAEGDQFLGLTVPQVRAIVRKHAVAEPGDALELVRSAVHEQRLAGLLLWVRAFERGDAVLRDEIHRLYLANTRFVNNWDLVDLSAPQIVGAALSPTRCGLLVKLARSKLIWERRIAVLATFSFIRRGQLAPTLRICRLLLKDEHDLIHKACGWMLREVGKRDAGVLREFLNEHAAAMPRTMLRYSIERLEAAERKAYLSRK